MLNQMTFEKTIEFLFSQLPVYQRIGKAAYKNDLTNTIVLDNYLGNPHRKYKIIHVGGTNGKGSVSHLIASVLQEAGYKTGLYTSPHLKDFRERIKINGEMIPKGEVVSFVLKHKELIDSLKPSFFEMTVAMAFDYFAEANVDVAIVEVGLGGRLDSTNIVDPVFSVITNIGHDHMDLLGDTLGKIAEEKAGIIKEKRDVIISETQPESEKIFNYRAAERKATIVYADKRFSCDLKVDQELSGSRQYIVTDKVSHSAYQGETGLAGDYQAANLKAVFASFDLLRNNFKVTIENLKEGIKNVIVNTGLSGRWQILNQEPLLVCDTAHNREGLRIVIQQILSLKKENLHIVIGFVNDKDINSVLPLFPADATYYFTRASVPRALDEVVLRNQAVKFGLKGNSYPDVSGALHEAEKNAGKKDMIFVGGSTFIVAEVL